MKDHLAGAGPIYVTWNHKAGFIYMELKIWECDHIPADKILRCDSYHLVFN